MAPRKAAADRGLTGGSATFTKVAPNLIVAQRMNRKATKTEKPIFNDLTFSIAGTMENTGGTTIPTEKIVGWILANAGAYVHEVNAKTTHLICSIKEYQKKGAQVQKACELNNTRHHCHIVVFDWLEDCLSQSHKKKRKMNETQYTLDFVIKRLQNGLDRRVAIKNRFEEGVRASKELCDSKLHKVYYEIDGFEYNVVVTRVDVLNGRVKTEKYTLYIFESNAKPHHYMFGAKFSRPHLRTTYHREDCHPKTLNEARHDFKHFFYRKTLVLWDDRLRGSKVDGAFVYTPPVLGQPTGLLPDGCVQREIQVALRGTDKESNFRGTDSRYDGPAPGSNAVKIHRRPESAKSESAGEGTRHNSQVNVYGEYGYQRNTLRH